jgi:hypothetical protein
VLFGPGAGRHLASWLITDRFLASLAVLVWVQRRWARGSRLAYLGLPAAVALLAVTIAAAASLL